MSCYTTKRRVARKIHHCAMRTWSRCDPIQPGDAYLVHTEFPGADAGYADHAGHPVCLAECAICAAGAGRDHQVEPIPEPQLDRYTAGIYQRGLV